MSFRGICIPSRRVVALFALLLAIAWVPMTSHELLEAAGAIHQDGSRAEHGVAHEAADGYCRLHAGIMFLKAPALFSVSWIVPVLELSMALFVACAGITPRRATESPPGLARTWQFALRLALPSRAPSFAH